MQKNCDNCRHLYAPAKLSPCAGCKVTVENPEPTNWEPAEERTPAENVHVKTNGDRLRAMTDEQFADMIAAETNCQFCAPICGEQCTAHSREECREIALKWLKQPCKEG